MNRVLGIVGILTLGVVTAACSKSGDSGGAGSDKSGETASADGYTKVPNISGLKAKVEGKLVPNGMGGAAGFHAKEGNTSIQIAPVSSDEAGQSFEDAKKSTEEMLFKKWIASEKTADGWVLTYERAALEGMAAGGPAFEVRKKVGDKTFKCWGSADNTADLAIAVDVCKSLKAS